MSIELISVCASIVAAIGGWVATFISWKIQKRTENFDEKAREDDKKWSIEFAKISKEIERIDSMKFDRIEIAKNFYNLLAGVQLSLEQYIVPFFAPSLVGDPALLEEAKKKFFEAYRFNLENKFIMPIPTGAVLDKIMGAINTIENYSGTGNKQAQQGVLLDIINPAMEGLGKAIDGIQSK